MLRRNTASIIKIRFDFLKIFIRFTAAQKFMQLLRYKIDRNSFTRFKSLGASTHVFLRRAQSTKAYCFTSRGNLMVRLRGVASEIFRGGKLQ